MSQLQGLPHLGGHSSRVIQVGACHTEWGECMEWGDLGLVEQQETVNRWFIAQSGNRGMTQTLPCGHSTCILVWELFPYLWVDE